MFISSSVISVPFKCVVLLGLRILFKHIIELLLNHFFFQCLYLWKKRVCFQHTSFYFLMEEETLNTPSYLLACSITQLPFGRSRGNRESCKLIVALFICKTFYPLFQCPAYSRFYFLPLLSGSFSRVL